MSSQHDAPTTTALSANLSEYRPVLMPRSLYTDILSLCPHINHSEAILYTQSKPGNVVEDIYAGGQGELKGNTRLLSSRKL